MLKYWAKFVPRCITPGRLIPRSLDSVSLDGSSRWNRFVADITYRWVMFVSLNRYVFEFAAIFLLLMIHSCFDNLRLRRWIFVEISTLFWSLIVESTNTIISSTSFFDFANFVVALRCEKIISFRWRTYSICAKQHVSNDSIYEQKRKQKIFFEFKYVFRNRYDWQTWLTCTWCRLRTCSI